VNQVLQDAGRGQKKVGVELDGDDATCRGIELEETNRYDELELTRLLGLAKL
jgi:hypothetical protein